MFVTISHPSQMRDKHRESQIRSHNARYLIAKRRRLKKSLKSSVPAPEIRAPDSNSQAFVLLENLSLLPEKLEKIRSLESDVNTTIAPVPTLRLCVETPFLSRTIRGLDFYINFLGPRGAWPSTHCKVCSGEDYKKHMIQMVVMDPLLFEASMSLAMMYLDCSHEAGHAIINERPSQAVLYHRGRSLSILLERMKEESKRLDDSTLFAIVALIVQESTYSDWPSYRANIAGFHHLIARRGGFSNLRWKCFMRVQLTWAHLRAASHEYATVPKKALRKERFASRYLIHPCSPNFHHLIPKLPAGLADLSLSGVLSINVLNLLDRTHKWTVRFNPDVDECCQTYDYYATGLQITITLADILARYSLNPEEEIFCIGLFAYINSTDGRKRLERQKRGLREFLTWIEKLSQEVSIGNPALLWSALSIAGTNEPMSWSARCRWHLLDLYVDHPDALSDWEDVLKTVKTFFWTPFLEERWRSCWNLALDRKRDRQTAASPREVHALRSPSPREAPTLLDTSLSSYVSSKKKFETP